MKHTLIYRATLLALIAAAATACSNEMTDAEGTGNGNNNEGKLITVTATQQAGDPNGQYQADQSQTRLDYNFPTNNGSVAVTWKKGDKFYVGNGVNWTTNKKLSDEASKFKPFTLQGEGGSKTGNFSGTMPDGTTDSPQLYALYGKVEQMQTASSGQAIDLNYEIQRQTANDDKAHLADYDFMTAYVTYQAGQQTAFNFTHQGAMMKFTITMPLADMTVKELRLAATDLATDGTTLTPFCTSPKWNITNNTLEQYNPTSNVYLKLGGDKGLLISGTTLTAYMMVAPTTLTATGNPIAGKKMMLLVTAGDDKIYSAPLTGAEIKKGHYYTVTAALSSSIFEGGNGTKDNPYKIHDAGHLRNMAILVNSNIMNANYKYFSSAYFKLTDDIELNNEEWTPIGTTQTFLGSFTGKKEDGGNYEIKDLKINGNYSSSSYLNFGLFGHLNGVVSNVTVSGEISPTITADNTGYAVYAGGIAGYNSEKTPATNCVSNCKINITNSPSNVYAGGIIGYIETQTVTLTNCSNTGAITLSTSNQSLLYAGGIIGYFRVYHNTYPFTLTLNGYSNAGTPAAVIGYYDFTKNSQSKIEIKQIKDSSNPIVITSGKGSYPAITNGNAGSYPDDGNMYQ